ncbi:MAG TPA: dihydrofolate reductase family protein [Rhodothermales bacterium]|nr:dihydrofolate reductase family protein [Rhodothermales bacterium]
MSTVFFDTGISLDGFMAGTNSSPDNPMGDKGPTIHQWMYQQKAFWDFQGQEGGNEDGADNALLEQTFRRAGAYIMGKRMFEEGEVHWPEDLYKAPVYVLTHEEREPWIQEGSTVFYFVNDGIESTLEQARAAANGKDIRIQGGASVLRQYLNAGLVDEFTVHIAPVILGDGIRLFDNLDHSRFSVEIVDVVNSKAVTHMHYSVTNKPAKQEAAA